jgi:hypothetical protein
VTSLMPLPQGGKVLSVSIGQEAGWVSGRGASGKKKSSSSSRPARRVVTVLTHLKVKQSLHRPGQP